MMTSLLPRAGPSTLTRTLHSAAVVRAGAPARKSFGLRAGVASSRPRDDREDRPPRPRTTFGLRDGPRDGGDRPPRRTFGMRDGPGENRPPRKTFGMRDTPRFSEDRPPRKTFGLRSEQRDDGPRSQRDEEPRDDTSASAAPTPPRDFPSRRPRISPADAARAGAESRGRWRAARFDRDFAVPEDEDIGLGERERETGTAAAWVGSAYTASRRDVRPASSGRANKAESTDAATLPSPEAAAEKVKTRWNPTKKLTYPAMAGIRELHAQDPETFTREMLAEKFGVSWEAINRILKSNNWREKEAKKEKELGKWDRGAGGGLGPVPMIREVFARAAVVKGVEKEAGTDDKGGRGGRP